MAQQADCLITLASLLRSAKQLDAAEEAGSRAVDLLPEKGEEFLVCKAHRVLGNIYQSKDETKKAIYHLEMALGIAASLNHIDQLFWVNYALVWLFSEQGKFEDAQTHIEHARAHAVNDAFLLARAMDGQAQLWVLQGRFEDAKSEALGALDAFEKLGAANNAETTRQLLRRIEANSLDRSNGDGELLKATLPVVYCADSS